MRLQHSLQVIGAIVQFLDGLQPLFLCEGIKLVGAVVDDPGDRGNRSLRIPGDIQYV